MAKRETFAKNYLFNLIYQTVAIALPLVTTPYISRVLGAENIGKYSFAHSIVSYFVLFAALGSTMYGQRLIARAGDDAREKTRLFFEVLILRAVGSAVTALIYCLTVIPRSSPSLLYWVVAIEIVTVAFDIIWFFQGAENFRPVAISIIVGRILAIGGIFFFVKSRDDLIIYAALYCASLLLGNLAQWIFLPKHLVKLEKGERRLRVFRHALPSLSLFVSQAAIQVYTVLDKTMIGVITGSDAENGYYEQSQRLCRVLVAIVCSLGAVMASRVAALWREGKKDEVYSLIEGSFRFIFALSVPMAVGVVLVASRFVPVFYGEGFDPVIKLLIALSPMLTILGCSNVIGVQLLVPTGRERLLTASVVVGAIVNVVLNLFLIKHLASLGAVIASLFAEAAVTGVQFFFVRREIKLLSILRLSVRYILFGGIMGGVGAVISRFAPDGLWGLSLVALPCIAVYGVLLLVTRDPVIRFFKKAK